MDRYHIFYIPPKTKQRKYGSIALLTLYLHTKFQLNWITMREVPLKAEIVEAQKEDKNILRSCLIKKLITEKVDKMIGLTFYMCLITQILNNLIYLAIKT